MKLMIFGSMNNFGIHSLKHVGKGESFDFSTLQLSNNVIAFIPSNLTSVVQPLDHEINCFIQNSVYGRRFWNGLSLDVILLLLTMT